MKSFYVIANPHANLGKSQKDWEQIQKYLDEHAVDYRATETSVAGDAQANIQAFLKNLDYADYEKYVVLVIGGNGTLNEVLTGIKEADVHDLPLAFICTSSHHQFADQLGIAPNPLVALKQILNATDAVQYSLIQYYESNHEETGYFLDNYSIGMAANLANLRSREHHHWLRTHCRWLANVIDICKAYYNSADAFSATLRIGHKYKFYKRAFIVNLQNRTQESDFSNNDQPIEVTIVDRVNIFLFLIFVATRKFGDPTKLPFVHHWRTDNLHITVNSLEQTQVDCRELGGKYNDLYLKLISYPFWINADSVSLEERRQK